jgi:hypothetical protein
LSQDLFENVRGFPAEANDVHGPGGNGLLEAGDELVLNCGIVDHGDVEGEPVGPLDPPAEAAQGVGGLLGVAISRRG